MIKKRILTIFLTSAMISSAYNFTVFADTPEYISNLIDNGMSTMEALEELAKSGEYENIFCKITVKFGTELNKLEENHHLELSQYDNVYYVSGSPEILMQYGNLENVEKIEFHYPEYEKEQRDEFADRCKAIVDNSIDTDIKPYVIFQLKETTIIDDILLPESDVFQKISIKTDESIIYYINAPQDELYNYIEKYRNSEYDGLVSFDVSVPAVPSLPAETIPMGDINSDGKIDITDLTEISLFLIGDRELTAAQQKVADVDGDGEVKLADLAKFRQFLSKQISSLG